MEKILKMIFGWIAEIKTEIRITLGILLLLAVGLIYYIVRKDTQIDKTTAITNEYLRRQLELCQKEKNDIREAAWQDKVKESDRWQRQREIVDSINNLSKNKR